MRQVSDRNFGLLIAYLLPGFVTLWGASFFSEPVRSWLGASSVGAPTVGGFLYVTVASVAVGLMVSVVRWMVVDSLHFMTGIRKPNWDFSRLHERLGAFEGLVENHYRYYQFYSNMLVAIVFTYVARQLSVGTWKGRPDWWDVGFLVAGVVLLVGSRDALAKYHNRAAELLGKKGVAPMTNGYHKPKTKETKKKAEGKKSVKAKPTKVNRSEQR